MRKINCASCEDVGIETPAVTIYHGQNMCEDCRDDLIARQQELDKLKEAYDDRNIRNYVVVTAAEAK